LGWLARVGPVRSNLQLPSFDSQFVYSVTYYDKIKNNNEKTFALEPKDGFVFKMLEWVGTLPWQSLGRGRIFKFL
jgi:hypothetical protein